MSSCGGAPLGILTSALSMLDSKYLDMLDDAVFMCNVREYLIDDMLIGTYRDQVAGQLGTALMFLSTVIMTIWVAYQGFQIIAATNRQPILTLGYKTGKMMLVLGLVSMLAANSPAVAETVLNFQALITSAIVGEDSDVYKVIDSNLILAQIFNALVDGLVGGQQAGADGKSLTTMAGLVGQSGPAMLVAVLAMMAEISITLAVMLSPLFIFFLLFQQTSAMFWTWAKFLLGTMVSLAVLALLSGVLLKMMLVYGASVVAAFYLNGSALGGLASFDIGGSAMRMASLGALSTALLMLVPPLIMQFFNSGAAFAAGAMAGVMGGGTAMGAARGLMGGAGPMGLTAPGQAGANGLPGASSADAPVPNYQLPPSVRGGGDGASGGVAMPAGSRGIANNPSEGGLNAAQNTERRLAEAKELRPGSDGVYATADTRAALANPNNNLGSGGRLPVQGSGNTAPAYAYSGAGAGAGATPASAPLPSPSSPPAGTGAGGSAPPPSSPGANGAAGGGTGAGNGSDTPVGRTNPNGQAAGNEGQQQAGSGVKRPVGVPMGQYAQQHQLAQQQARQAGSGRA